MIRAGITTSNPELMEGLVVGYKGPRVFLYQNSTVKAVVELDHCMVGP